jgi:hypothetical protein
MKRILALLLGVFVSITCVSRAQNQTGPSFNPNNPERLEQSKMSLVKALESNSPGLQATAAQTVRELKALIPDESFSSLVIPLMRIVKNEDAASESRILAALALHELHSERGDFAIKGESRNTGDKRFQYICSALVVERAKEVQLAQKHEEGILAPSIANSR